MSYPAGTLDLAKVKSAIYDWIKEATQGVLEDENQIIWRNQSEMLPARPCVALKLIDPPGATDRDPSVFLNAAGAPIGAGMQMEAMLSVQVFGNIKIHRPIALQLAVDLHSSLLMPSVRRKLLSSGGVAIQGLGKPQNLTALEESNYEERSGFDVSLGLVQNIVDKAAGEIKTVNLETDFNNVEKTQEIILP